LRVYGTGTREQRAAAEARPLHLPRDVAMKTFQNLLMPAIFSLACVAPSLAQPKTA
jgi:hypothetical protein